MSHGALPSLGESTPQTTSDGFSRKPLLEQLARKIGEGLGTACGPQSDRSPIQLSDLVIRTKHRELVAFRPNDVQALYLDELLPGWRTGDLAMHGLREMILKARQEGLSTLIEALFFVDTITTPNTVTVVVANDAGSTGRMFRMVQTMYERLPPQIRPLAKYANRHEYFWPELNSSYYVGTAGDRTFGRGDTINNVHASEVPHWPDAESLMTGLLEAVPEEGNVFVESTAKGLGNYFHTRYMEALSGGTSFTARFFGWNLLKEYETDVPPGFARTLEEGNLASLYALNDRQLAWRRKKIGDLKEKFPQEYPIKPSEAFLASGNPYFDRVALDAMLDEVEAGFWPAIAFEVPGQFASLRNGTQDGQLQLWELPQDDEVYVICADTAEGIEEEGKDHDYDSADVLKASDWSQVGVLHGRWDTHDYGMMLADLGFWFNTAVLAIERNNHGHAVINAALHTAKYPAMKHGEPSGLYFHEDYDEKKRAKVMRPGWPTTPKTKYFALDGLATSIDHREILIRCRASLMELMTFVKLPGGKAGGEGKSHDDRVSSLAIGDAVIKALPRRTRAKRELRIA